MITNDHLRLSQVAEMLNVSNRTLNRWHALRLGPSRVKVGRTILYRKKAIEQWLAANETQPTRLFEGASS